VLSVLRIERQERGQPGEFERLSDAELMELAKRQANDLGCRDAN
jgi:hypothetical protein